MNEIFMKQQSDVMALKTKLENDLRECMSKVGSVNISMKTSNSNSYNTVVITEIDLSEGIYVEANNFILNVNGDILDIENNEDNEYMVKLENELFCIDFV